MTVNSAKPDDTFLPSILLSETHFNLRGIPGEMADAVARVADEGFYRSIEISIIEDFAERKRIGARIRASGISVTMWMSAVLTNENLNLSSQDDAMRSRSVNRIKEHIEQAAECGTGNLVVLSGPDPGPPGRVGATECLYESLCELCEVVLTSGFDMRLVLEPLDRGAHKNGLIGPTLEAVSLARRVRESFPDFGLSWDTAHVLLCGEDLRQSLSTAAACISQIHLANPVLDANDPRFGDNHIPIGPPGALNNETIEVLFRDVLALGLFPGKKIPVAVEIRTLKGGDPWQTERMGREVLERVL